jgi:tetratricopeptide (TPR) repeat protein
VRQLLDTLAETPEHLAERAAVRANIMMHMARQGDVEDLATSLFQEGRELAARSGDAHVLSRVLRSFGLVRSFAGATEEALNPLLESIKLADGTGDTALRVVARYGLGTAYVNAGRFREGLTFVEQGIELTQGDLGIGAVGMGFSPSLGFSVLHGLVLSLGGHPREGGAELDRVIEIARPSHFLAALYFSHASHVPRCEVMGETAAALAHARQAVDCAERAGSQIGRISSYRYLGIANLLNCRWHDALEVLEQALAIGRERRLQSWQSAVLAGMAGAHFGFGDCQKALALAEESIAGGRELGTRFGEFSALLTRSRALRETQGLQATTEIGAALAEADAWLEMSGAKSYEPFLHVERAELARLNGDDATRQRELREAHRLFLEIDAPIRAAEVAKELGR